MNNICCSISFKPRLEAIFPRNAPAELYINHTFINQVSDGFGMTLRVWSLEIRRHNIQRRYRWYCWWFRNPARKPPGIFDNLEKNTNLHWLLNWWSPDSEPSTVSLTQIGGCHPSPPFFNQNVKKPQGRPPLRNTKSVETTLSSPNPFAGWAPHQTFTVGICGDFFLSTASMIQQPWEPKNLHF